VNNYRNQQMDMIERAEKAMEIDTQHFFVDPPLEGDNAHKHRHVAIAWEGGVVWLDMSVQSDHFCIDVRQFVPDEEGTQPTEHGVQLAGQGVFTIVNGRRQCLAAEVGGGKLYSLDPLKDPDGTPVLGHGWNAGYVVTLMHDKEPSERQTNRRAGPGRG
jgi:hypothetical protein